MSTNGYTPLLCSAFYGSTKFFELLLEAGAEVDKADMYGHTPLYLAANLGNLRGVEILLSAGADLNKADNNGCNSLYLRLLVMVMLR